jgi:hypothetical protein
MEIVVARCEGTDTDAGREGEESADGEGRGRKGGIPWKAGVYELEQFVGNAAEKLLGGVEG